MVQPEVKYYYILLYNLNVDTKVSEINIIIKNRFKI